MDAEFLTPTERKIRSTVAALGFFSQLTATTMRTANSCVERPPEPSNGGVQDVQLNREDKEPYPSQRQRHEVNERKQNVAHRSTGKLSWQYCGLHVAEA